MPELIKKIEGRDPIFLARRAFLLCDLAAFDEALELTEQALADVREKRARDRRSIWVISRYAWIYFLVRQMRWREYFSRADEPDGVADEQDQRQLSSELRELYCEPSDELREVEGEISRLERGLRKRGITSRPHFDAGAFTKYSPIAPPSVNDASPVGDFVSRIASRVAVPSRFRNLNILAGSIKRVLAVTTYVPNRQRLQLCALLEDAKADSVDRFFNRIAVANLPIEVVREVIRRLLSSIEELMPYASGRMQQGRARDMGAVQDQIGLMLEIASRLVIRLPSAEANAVLARGFAWARDPIWVASWTSEPLGNLLSRAMEAVPKEGGSGHISALANHPLPGEKSAGHLAQYWPEPAFYFRDFANSCRPEESQFAARVSFLFEQARDGAQIDRERALLRLERFYQAGLLNSEEIRSFAAALWGRVASDGLPADTRFYVSAFFELPQVMEGQTDAAVRAAFFSSPTLKISERLLQLLGATTSRSGVVEPSLRLKPQEALVCLDAILAPAPSNPTTIVLHADGWGDPLIDGRRVGAALSVGILSALGAAEIGEERLNGLLDLLVSRRMPSTSQAWPQIVRLAPSRHNQAATEILADLLSTSEDRVNASLWALERWRDLAGTQCAPIPKLPQVLAKALVARVATRDLVGLSGALNLVGKLCRDKALDDTDLKLILQALDALIEETKSEPLGGEDEFAALRAGTLTIIRREAARLALVMNSLGIEESCVSQWVALIKDDPFPEVRSLREETEF